MLLFLIYLKYIQAHFFLPDNRENGTVFPDLIRSRKLNKIGTWVEIANEDSLENHLSFTFAFESPCRGQHKSVAT